MPTLNPNFRTILTNIPKNVPHPAFNPDPRSLFANSISNTTAPTNGPKNIPQIPPTNMPTIPPIIAPPIPHPVPPNFFAPNAAAMLSANVDAKQRINMTMRVNGVIFWNLSIIAATNVEA